MIKVGIFWVINSKTYCKFQYKREQMPSQKENIIDSSYSHFNEWDNLCSRACKNADFATFPRGRVMYDVKNNEHIVYVDECITCGELKRVVQLFEISKYRIAFDEHYTCDRCKKRKGDIFS